MESKWTEIEPKNIKGQNGTKMDQKALKGTKMHQNALKRVKKG